MESVEEDRRGDGEWGRMAMRRGLGKAERIGCRTRPVARFQAWKGGTSGRIMDGYRCKDAAESAGCGTFHKGMRREPGRRRQGQRAIGSKSANVEHKVVDTSDCI